MVPYYDKTVQADMCDLMARKVTASLQVDGLDLKGALEAAGAAAKEEGNAGAEIAMALGRAIYRRIQRRTGLEGLKGEAGKKILLKRG